MSARTPLTHQQVIEAIGLDQLATFLGADRAHIRQMKNRDRIPDHYWNKVVSAAEAAKLKHISLKTLADAAERKAREQ